MTLTLAVTGGIAVVWLTIAILAAITLGRAIHIADQRPTR